MIQKTKKIRPLSPTLSQLKKGGSRNIIELIVFCHLFPTLWATSSEKSPGNAKNEQGNRNVVAEMQEIDGKSLVRRGDVSPSLLDPVPLSSTTYLRKDFQGV